MTDQTMFEKIFASFLQKFPPAVSLKEATLRFTTTEMEEMLTDFNPDMQWPSSGFTQFLIDQGYKFEPFEVNERVRYFWLIGSE